MCHIQLKEKRMKNKGKAEHPQFNFREMKITYLHSKVFKNLYIYIDLYYIYANVDIQQRIEKNN